MRGRKPLRYKEERKMKMNNKERIERLKAMQPNAEKWGEHQGYAYMFGAMIGQINVLVAELEED